jgi:hypothetical protein
MAQQDKISILGLNDDGSYVVEFRTAAGKKLAITSTGDASGCLPGTATNR